MSETLTCRDVVQEGFCVGCGACAVVDPKVRMNFAKDGTYSPDLSRLSPVLFGLVDKVCPFSGASENEDQISSQLFDSQVFKHDAYLGSYFANYVGYALEADLREKGSSGGLTTWLLAELIKRRLVDGVIHVGSADDKSRGRLFVYTTSYSKEQLLQRRKSQYYPVEISDVIKSIRGDGKRYAFVGLPCYIKVVRNLALQDHELRTQLRYFVGLVCGHLKSARFADIMAWQLGIPPSRLEAVDFRRKSLSGSASNYEFAAKAWDSKYWVSRKSKDLLGGDWGHALFQLNACDYCDDIFAETSDICFGDAWCKPYDDDWRGHNIVICRNEMLDRVLNECFTRGEILLHSVSPAEVHKTQSGNIRHRREGLSFRLKQRAKAARRAPRKRVAAGTLPISLLRREIVRTRQALARQSHIAFMEAIMEEDLELFIKAVRPLRRRMKWVYRLIRCSNSLFNRS